MGKTLKKKAFIPKDHIFSYNLDTVLLCAGLLAVGIFLNGKAALYQAVACLLSSVICEYVCFLLILKKNSFRDLSAFASALTIALLLPATAPLYVGVIASAFAVAVAKFPFGGCINAPFVPAAAGFGCVALLFPGEVFSYVSSADSMPLIDMLIQGKAMRINAFSLSSLLSGTVPGAAGTTSLLALGGVFLYRLVRNPKSLIVSVSFIFSASLFVCLFPRLNTGIITCVISEISAGGLLFTSLMLINDPVSSPSKPLRSIVYGFIGGVFCMLLRYFGNIYDGSVFAVLIMNCLWPAFTGETASSKHSADKKSEKPEKEKLPKKDKKPSVRDCEPGYNLFEENALSGGSDR